MKLTETIPSVRSPMDYYTLDTTERSNLARQHLGDPSGRDTIAEAFQSGLASYLDYYSIAHRLFDTRHLLMRSNPTHTLNIEAHPTIEVKDLAYDLRRLDRIWSLMRSTVHTHLDTWAIELLHQHATDLGSTHVDDLAPCPTDTRLGGPLDQLIDAVPTPTLFLNAADYGKIISAPECKARIDRIGDRNLLRTGAVGFYRESLLMLSRLIPYGTIYACEPNALGHLHYTLRVQSADVPELKQVGWKATAQPHADITETGTRPRAARATIERPA